jgi:glycosyltransferase involved in cell wall biosynthesis
MGEAPPDQVQQYGFLDKSKPEELQLLNRLYTEADAFILPSSREGYNNSILMAAAFGVPTLAYDANGVRDAVAGSSGLLLPLGSAGKVFAEAIRTWQTQPTAYAALVTGARRHYETKANWSTAVRTLIKCIENALDNPRRQQALTDSAAVRTA